MRAQYEIMHEDRFSQVFIWAARRILHKSDGISPYISIILHDSYYMAHIIWLI